MNEENDPIVGDAPPADNTLLSNSVYDKLKQVAAIWLPALAVFYITVAPFWGLPKQEEVAGTLIALDLLLGTGLTVLSSRYKKSDARFDGAIDLAEGDEPNTTAMNFRIDPNAVYDKDEVLVKVNKPV